MRVSALSAERSPVGRHCGPRLLWLQQTDWLRIVKPADSIMTVAAIDPLVRLVFPLLIVVRITPNQVTLLRLMVALSSGLAFILECPVTGALLFVAWYLLDCMDGKLARFRGTASPFGDWLDRTSDRVGVGLMVLAEGVYLRNANWPNGVEVCLFFLGGWYLSITNDYVLSAYRKVLPAPDVTGKRGGVSVALSLFDRWRQWTAAHRLRELLVDDPEWLALAIAVAALVRSPLIVMVALIGLLSEKTIVTAVFWFRRAPCRA